MERAGQGGESQVFNNCVLGKSCCVEVGSGEGSGWLGSGVGV